MKGAKDSEFMFLIKVEGDSSKQDAKESSALL